MTRFEYRSTHPPRDNQSQLGACVFIQGSCGIQRHPDAIESNKGEPNFRPPGILHVRPCLICGFTSDDWVYDVLCMVITYSKSMDKPGKVANPARGQLNREHEYFSVPVRA